MGPERRKLLLLGALVAVLSALVYRHWSATPSPGTVPAPTARATARSADAVRQEALSVFLDRLEAERPRPAVGRRNLFRFGGARPAVLPDAAPAAPTVAVRPPEVAPVPAPAPISLRLIGIVETPGQRTRVAVLSDEHGVYHGREGDIIEGRYRIQRVNAESVEMSRLDGGTPQVIHLSGL
jgi:hypothetical protein